MGKEDAGIRLEIWLLSERGLSSPSALDRWACVLGVNQSLIC